MLDPPDKQMLLQAVGEFLLTEIKPAINDAKLGFRVLIAANLLMVVGNELRDEAAQDAAELTRLRALFPGVDGDTAALNRVLAEQLRAGTIDPARLERVRAHLQETLRDRLRINNPSFDLRADVDTR